MRLPVIPLSRHPGRRQMRGAKKIRMTGKNKGTIRASLKG
jgi:hypothetical protein